ncbi:trypsin-like serine protease [Cereibacter changlensis]|uniref:Serine protease n=1 Tax=Cereibacter changlensis TaxID=402884 RepID=A0A4V5NLA5_9RHOB|nr:trypsin-like serine protease [Cereibacter changlensis]TKA94867.1 trypsin-like serine protease [Cereibacter changlensis]
MRLIPAVLLSLLLAAAATADESPLRSLQTSDDSRGWNAVGKILLGRKGFCTGTLIGPQRVLTAAHCLYDKDSGLRIEPSEIQFLAGWRNGRAEAYRQVRRAVPHPLYSFGGLEQIERVEFDIAVLELDQPIRQPSILPFATGLRPETGDEVGVVSYAQDRSEAPALQEVCHVLGRQPAVLVLSCNVDFGSSGAPIFSMQGGVAQVVSVVSAKADVEGRKVALGTALQEPLAEVLAELEAAEPARRAVPTVRILSGGMAGGAKFVRPATP